MRSLPTAHRATRVSRRRRHRWRQRRKRFPGVLTCSSPGSLFCSAKVSHRPSPDNRGMQRADPASPAARPTRTWAERVFGHWWRRQSAARQDRYATLGPLLSVLLLLAAIVSAFWYLRNEAFEREQE